MENTFCFDWLSFTIKINKEEELKESYLSYILDNLKILDLNLEILDSEKGRYGYNSFYTINNSINIYFNKIRNKSEIDFYLNCGIHIEFTGDGCRLLERVISDWKSYFEFIINKFDVRFSRLDVALDDYNRLLNFNVIENKIKKGHIITKSKKREIIDEITKKETFDNKGNSKGKTFYFGVRSSDIFIRFYDKKLEQLNKGNDCELDSWQRYEIVFKKDKAISFIDEFIKYDNLSALYLGVISDLIKFVEPKGNNKSRWPISKFWEVFLKKSSIVKLGKKEYEMNIYNTIKWVDKSIISTIKMLDDCLKLHNKNIYDILEKADRDMSIKQFNYYNLFKNQNFLEQKRIIEKIEDISKKKNK